VKIVRIEAAELKEPGLVEDHDVPALQGDQVFRPERLQRSVHMDCREPKRVTKLFLSDRQLVAVTIRKPDGSQTQQQFAQDVRDPFRRLTLPDVDQPLA
jgi:hypothetical protein